MPQDGRSAAQRRRLHELPPGTALPSHGKQGALDKGRCATSFPDELRPKLWAYIEGTARNLGFIPIAVGGTANHAHLLLGLKPNANIAEAVQKLKANSSRWMGEHRLTFEWQKGYAALSVSPSLVGVVRSYVLNQEEHHRRRSFEEEFLALLNKAGYCSRQGTRLRGVTVPSPAATQLGLHLRPALTCWLFKFRRCATEVGTQRLYRAGRRRDTQKVP